MSYVLGPGLISISPSTNSLSSLNTAKFKFKYKTSTNRNAQNVFTVYIFLELSWPQLNLLYGEVSDKTETFEN